MAKFYGKVGYAETEELKDSPGVWKEYIIERSYYGDILKISRRLQSSGGINDDVTINNEISIVADPFAYENFSSIRYVEWQGIRWKVSNTTIQHPRLILSLGVFIMGTRVQLHQILKNISVNVYYQPPEGFKMKYPCIRYTKNRRDTLHADNLPYKIDAGYTITVMYSNPDSKIPDEVAKLPTAKQTAGFRTKNLYHDVFDIYF